MIRPRMTKRGAVREKRRHLADLRLINPRRAKKRAAGVVEIFRIMVLRILRMLVIR
jgi:hypothetical protein